VELLAPLRLKAGGAKAGLLGSDVARFLSAATELVSDVAGSTESWSAPRRLMVELALSVATQKAGISERPELEKLRSTLWSLNLLAEWAPAARAACDAWPLYWLRELMPAMVACAATAVGAAAADADARAGARLPFLFAAFSDPAKHLEGVAHMRPPPPAARRLVGEADLRVSGEAAGLDARRGGAPPAPQPADRGLDGVEHLLTAYERYLHGIVTEDLVEPLCRAVEADLRMVVHAVHLAHMPPPPVRGRPPLVYLLALPPFRVVGAYVDIKARVSHYLEKTFYELTTLALHDWKTCVPLRFHVFPRAGRT
jgi:hypothetical protein